MGRYSSILGQALQGALFGCILVIIPFFPMPSLMWIAGVIALACDQRPDQTWSKWLGMFSTRVLAMTVILIAAVVAPVKTQDRVLKQQVTLPKTGMSLKKLEQFMNLRQLQAPSLGHLSFPETEAARVIRWPAKELTVREFVKSIEEQTPLRHRFRFCPVGGTILWGPDYALVDLGMPNH